MKIWCACNTKQKDGNMNKQELKKHIEDLPYNVGLLVDTIKISRNGLLKLIDQLDEPEKVTVPQFVADWIEYVKENGIKFKNIFGFYEVITHDDNVYRVIYYILKNNIATADIRKWVDDNTDTFARAWLDGFTIEKEKRYTVKLKGLEGEKCYLNFNFGGVWLFGTNENFFGYRSHHTCKELEDAGFGEVFDSKLFEVEEVEE